jgi:LacI family transcriptional regulator
MPVKMKDIARDLGVSVVTISKALRNHPDISKATRQRVLERVQELNYRPNLAARSLVTGHSSLIGLIVPDLMHPFFADVAKGLSLALRQQGYFLVLSSSEEDPELEKQEIENILAHRLDALVVASCQTTGESLEKTQQGDTPLILVDRSFKSFRSNFVGSDDYAAAKLATEHLIAVGCRRIAHIRGPETSVGHKRLKGFLDTLKRHKIELPEEYVIRAPQVDVNGRGSGADAVKRLQALARRPDGIFCYNDPVGMGVLSEAHRQGIRVPQDLAVIGCGNLHYDSDIRVPLSSIDQRSREVGTRAAAMILELLGKEGPEVEFRNVVLQPKLVARESTAREVAEPMKAARKRSQSKTAEKTQKRSRL